MLRRRRATALMMAVFPPKPGDMAKLYEGKQGIVAPGLARVSIPLAGC